MKSAIVSRYQAAERRGRQRARQAIRRQEMAACKQYIGRDWRECEKELIGAWHGHTAIVESAERPIIVGWQWGWQRPRNLRYLSGTAGLIHALIQA